MSCSEMRKTPEWAVTAKERTKIAASARFIRLFYARCDRIDEEAEFDRLLNHGMDPCICVRPRAKHDGARHSIGETLDHGDHLRVDDDRPVVALRQVVSCYIGSGRDVDGVALAVKNMREECENDFVALSDQYLGRRRGQRSGPPTPYVPGASI